MVSLSFTSFNMLVMVLFIFLTIKDTIAHSDDNKGKQSFVVHEAENGYARAPSVEKEVVYGVLAAAEFNNYGRKMMIERKNMKKVEEADSKNSGNSNNPSNPLDESRMNTQNQGYKKSASGHNSKYSTDKLVSTNNQPDDDESFQKLDSEKLLEDATDFFTMMNKDYVGGPGSGSKPRHKPPINNFQPLHTSNP
ncbi:hypothetical protein HAX54_052163 [Datura stramonium]|uniref:Uncharacterized protein n=1 Tax=Datura stramonium TaxID=4076 RepID=A0ABS8WQX1_DATST|nr:hypothetical protein [Datura stramonium]